MFPRSRSRPRLTVPGMIGLSLALALAACTAPGPASPTAAGSPTAELGILPAVEGFTYRDGIGAVPGFVRGVDTTLAGEEGDSGVEVLQAGLATRGEDEVLVIAFGFPGATDEASVDAMGRILDGMEDTLQAPAVRGLDDRAYVIDGEGQSVVMAPWARTDHLVLLFVNGPTAATHDLARGILDSGR